MGPASDTIKGPKRSSIRQLEPYFGASHLPLGPVYFGFTNNVLDLTDHEFWVCNENHRRAHLLYREGGRIISSGGPNSGFVHTAFERYVRGIY